MAAEEKAQFDLAAEAEHRPWKFNPRRNGFSACPIPLEKWSALFSDLLNPPTGSALSLPPAVTEMGDPGGLCNRPFSEEEVERVVLHSKDKKGAGIDGITNEHWKGSWLALGCFWIALFNCIFLNGAMVKEWKSSFVKILYKGKGSVVDPGSYRGIALLPHIFKAYTKLLADRLSQVVQDTIPREQHGFLRGWSNSGMAVT